MRIIYDNNGTASVLTPSPSLIDSFDSHLTETEKLELAADRILTTGTSYEIVDDIEVDKDSVPDRDLWTYTPGPNAKVSKEFV